AGAVTVGNGRTARAILLPGHAKQPGTLTVNNTVTFNSLAGYECVLRRNTGKASKLKAMGVTINPNATFSLLDFDTGMLKGGTVFTIINNSSANPIFG